MSTPASAPPTHQVSPRVEAALRDAIERLLTGKPRHTNGRLIKDNLWREAKVSRATMNRATAVLREWDARLIETDARTPGETKRDTELTALSRKLKAAQADNQPLKARLEAAATIIAALNAENIALREQLARRGDVVSLDARRHHATHSGPPTDTSTDRSEP